MAVLNFTLNPESLSKFHDALVCLGKFSEAVCIEATLDKLVLTALNSSKSAYASFTFTAGNHFFVKYQFKGTEKFSCRIYNKALLSVFKGRLFDPTRERDTSAEKCEVSVEDGEGKAKSRFVVKILCRNGVLKTYRLTFESIAPMHAQFVQESANNRWSISSRTLRDFVEHFGPGTEQLDINCEGGQVRLTSYTEKVMSGNEILKQPLHTTITLETRDFNEFTVEEQLHIVVSVKDFKSIIAHAGITNTNVRALYSLPSSPMQITYNDENVQTEFILMTIGESRAASATPVPNASRASSKRPAPRQPLEATPHSKWTASDSMPPPPIAIAANTNQQISKPPRPSPPPPQPSIQAEALFYPETDEDRRWDPMNYEEEEDEGLLWDARGDNDTSRANSGRRLQSTVSQNLKVSESARRAAQQQADARLPPTQRLAPTQRLSEVRGLFDE